MLHFAAINSEWNFPDDWENAQVFSAYVLTGGGLIGVIYSLYLLQATATELREHPNQLVTTGPFAWTRNPFYVSQILLMVSVCLVVNLWWLAVAAVLHWMFVSCVSIPAEEALLAKTYGAQWEEYTTRVSRYLV